MRLRAALLLISGLILAVSGGVGQQQTQTTAEVTQHDAPFTFSTGVNLVLVPVVVRDRQGRAIGTLKKEDFQLFDKGKLQEISKFSVEKAEAPPTLPDTSIETDANGIPWRKLPVRPRSPSPGISSCGFLTIYI